MGQSNLQCNTSKTEVLVFGSHSPIWCGDFWPSCAPSHPWHSDPHLGGKIWQWTFLQVPGGQCDSLLPPLENLEIFFFLLPAQCQKMVIHAVITLRLDYASALYWSFLKYQLETPASTECCSLTPAKSLEIWSHSSTSQGFTLVADPRKGPFQKGW